MLSVVSSERREGTEPSRRQNASVRRVHLVECVQLLADKLAGRPNLGITSAPTQELGMLRELGLLTACLPLSEGGLALGVEPGTQAALMATLAAVGGADLALGRLYEGHVNGLLLVQQYGTNEQITQICEEVRSGALSGVWNTGAQELLRLIPDGSGYRLQGTKTFATGAEFVRRPIVTAELEGGWQMTLPRMEQLDLPLDRSFWHPLGMASSESFGVDFSGAWLEKEHLVGAPGDFYLDPIFRGGAIRFAAVQAGAVMRLHRMFADWLVEAGRGDDPYQTARLGDLAIAAMEAEMWIAKASQVAEDCFHVNRDRPQPAEDTASMVDCANMMRVAIERLGTNSMQKVVMGVGAHGLLRPAPFERIIRDLTMYLRQPAPDATLAAIGRRAIELRGSKRGWAEA